MADDDKRRFWWCGGKDGVGHVVGELGYVDLRNVGRVSVLLLYEQALATPPAEIPPVRAKLFGTVLEVQCTCCDQRFNWWMGEAGMQRLLERVLARKN